MTQDRKDMSYHQWLDAHPPGVCEGRCWQFYECEGNVSKYHVVGKDGRDWGTFWYCEYAKNQDQQDGFTVAKTDDQSK